jgi:hypothetical protein
MLDYCPHRPRFHLQKTGFSLFSSNPVPPPLPLPTRSFIVACHPMKSFMVTAQALAAWSALAASYYSLGAEATFPTRPTPRPTPRPTTRAPVTPPPTQAPVAVPDAPSSCPLTTLDFTGLPNPMARYYGQNATLQAGDYLLDQLWWTHGVKVSARILSDTHKTSDQEIFIPKFNRGTGWVDSKRNQSTSDPSSGGAIRLFDSYRPNWNTNPAYRQPLCAPSTTNGVGDNDLGAPNEHCPGGGPGTYSCVCGLLLSYVVWWGSC